MSVQDKPLVNRVANSSLITFNLEDYFPRELIREFDLKDHLFQGLILKEKDFRGALKDTDWSNYAGVHLAIHCSTDAIIPVWAYMLVATMAKPHVKSLHLGTPEELLKDYYEKVVEKLDASQFEGQRMVIKGCSNKPVPTSAYVSLAEKLQPYAQSIMFGEPCSTVPIFKRPRKIR